MATEVVTKVFHASDSAPFREEEAPAVGAELERLAALHGADVPALEPAEIVAAAQEPSSPLHRFFVWDDSSAGHLYRLHQARNLVNHLRVEIIYQDRPQPTTFLVPGLVSIRTEPGVRAYVPIGTALDNEAMIAQLAQEAMSQAQHWLRRFEAYRALAGFERLAPIFAAIETLGQE